MPQDVFNDPNLLLEYYRIQSDDFRMRHSAIWTEVQHYTWVLSVVLAVGPVAAIGRSTLNPDQLGFLLFLPVVGVAIGILAFLIIRRDFVYYTRADSRLLYLEKQLGVVLHEDYIDDRLRRAQSASFSVSQDVKEQLPIGVRSVINLRIRGLILTIFIVYIIAGMGEVVYFSILLF